MIIKKTQKAFKPMVKMAVSKVPKISECTEKKVGQYYKAKFSKPLEISFNVDKKTYRYNFITEQLQVIPNPYNVSSTTYMSNLNKLFAVYANEATSEAFKNAVAEKDDNDRNFELLQLTLNDDFRIFCSKSEHTNKLMLAKNFFNHAGLSHGRESSRVNKTGDSNYRDEGIDKMKTKEELSDWLKGNPSAVANVGKATKKAVKKAKATKAPLITVSDEAAKVLTPEEIEALAPEQEPSKAELEAIAQDALTA